MWDSTDANPRRRGNFYRERDWSVPYCVQDGFVPKYSIFQTQLVPGDRLLHPTLGLTAFPSYRLPDYPSLIKPSTYAPLLHLPILKLPPPPSFS